MDANAGRRQFATADTRCAVCVTTQDVRRGRRSPTMACVTIWRRSPKHVLKVQLGQPVPVQQHDLALGLAEEAEDAHAVKM